MGCFKNKDQATIQPIYRQAAMWNLIKRIANNTKQNQGSGDNSTNLQGKSITINNGITYKDAKEIALDVFKSNFIELKFEAANIAQSRAEEVTEKILEQLKSRNPDAITEFAQPAMQDSLFTVQKQYAKSGDKELGDLLVDILVDRAAEPKRNMLQIVLDEALIVAPKLTIEQLDTITINFLLAQTRRLDVKNYADLATHFEKRICPFIGNLTKEQTYFNHIEYLGCGHVRPGEWGQLEVILRRTYKGFFSNGFSSDELKNQIQNHEKIGHRLIQCFHDSSGTKLQLSFFDDDALDKLSIEDGLSPDDVVKLKHLYETSTMPAHDVKNILIASNPLFEKLFEIWDGSPLKKMELTSVGIAIAHANYRRRTGDTMNLSIWIK
jgi:hypothetical protein